MEGFDLKIVTPDGCRLECEAKSLVVRTTVGDVGIMKNHSDYVSTIDSGKAKITLTDGTIRIGICRNGFFSMSDNHARLVVSSFSFSDEKDSGLS